MKLQKLRIKNFKSIVDLELVNPSPFSVFVGPNGAGKSNIFEALEIANLIGNMSSAEVERLLGGKDNFVNFNSENSRIELEIETEINSYVYRFPDENEVTVKFNSANGFSEKVKDSFVGIIVLRFGRLFTSSSKKTERPDYRDSSKLNFTASNLDKVLVRIFTDWDSDKRSEFIDWLKLFIPEFEGIEIHYDAISGIDSLFICEKYSRKPFSKSLISDGTINILALLTSVYQSDEPQFLCIEEPENGLHPQVVMNLVEFFRQKCEEKGHYIWINTHSESLVRKLHSEEIILVDKRKGQTQIKQVRDMNLYDLPTDEAWLTGALGGGLPW